VIAQSPSAGRLHTAADALGFTEDTDGHVSRDAADTLVFTETVGLNFIRVRAAADTLGLDDFATLFNADPTRPPVTAPAIAHAVTLATGAGSVVLPAPEFGNTEALSQTRVSRQSRGGTYIVARPPYWPTSDEFTLQFKFVSRAAADRLQDLLARTVGTLVTYTDHEGNSWQVIVTNPESAVTADWDDDNVSVALNLIVAK
jgi:hypothetical protein